MMKSKISHLCIVSAFALSTCFVFPSTFVWAENSKPSKPEIERVLKLTVNNIVRPALLSFSNSANAMSSSMKELCTNPSMKKLENSRAAFKQVAIAWGGIEHFRSGLILEENRLERILFYPDRKSTGLKQVQRRLLNKDVTLTDLKSMQTKSVAVQGLGAIEFLLFGSGYEELKTSSGSFRCDFAKTASQNVEAISNEVLTSWNGGSAYTKGWMNAGTSNSVFANEQEAINELLGILVHGLGAVRDIRIGGFLNKEAKYDRPKSALLWRSQSTVPVLKANFEMLEALMVKGGLYSLVKEDLNGTVNSLQFEFMQINYALNSIEPPIVDALQDEDQRKKLVFLKNSLGYLIERIDGEFALMLGLSSGFSFSDGD